MSNTLDITADAMITAAATALNAAVEKVCALSQYPLSYVVWSQVAALRYFAGESAHFIKDKLATTLSEGGAVADSIKDCLQKLEFWDNWHILKDSLTARIKDCPEFLNVACATLTDAGLVLAAPTPGDFEELLPALPSQIASQIASRIASRTPEQPTHPVTPLAPIALEGAGASLVDAPVTESLEGAKRNLLTNFEAAQGQGTDLEEDDFEIVVHIMPPYVPPAVQEEVAPVDAPTEALTEAEQEARLEAPKRKRKAQSQGKVEPRQKRQCKFPKNLDDYC